MRAIFLDIETNGLDFFTHRVIDIAFQIICLKTGDCLARFESKVAISAQEWAQSDKNSLNINGFCEKNHDLEAAQSSCVAQAIIDLFTKYRIHKDHCFYICQNPSFDRPFFSQLISPYQQESLAWPYRWLDLASMYWAKHLAYQKPASAQGLTKDCIAHFLRIEPEPKPHQAMKGVEHLIACYKHLIGWEPRNDEQRNKE